MFTKIIIKNIKGFKVLLLKRYLYSLTFLFINNISYEHFLFVNIVKQKQQKISPFYKKKFVDFKNSIKIKFCWKLIFFILSWAM